MVSGGGGVSPPLIVDSEAVGVNGVGAVVHQFMDPDLKVLINVCGAGFDGLEAADRLFSAVGHVDDELLIDGIGEGGWHCLLGLCVWGECSSPMSIR